MAGKKGLRCFALFGRGLSENAYYFGIAPCVIQAMPTFESHAIHVGNACFGIAP